MECTKRNEHQSLNREIYLEYSLTIISTFSKVGGESNLSDPACLVKYG